MRPLPYSPVLQSRETGKTLVWGAIQGCGKPTIGGAGGLPGSGGVGRRLAEERLLFREPLQVAVAGRD